MITASTPQAFITDTQQRPLRDLRISVTDRCNLRCTYCMPREVFGKDFVFLPRAELLDFEEIEHVARLFVQLGVHKIRLSGGEPLMRHGIERLIEKFIFSSRWLLAMGVAGFIGAALGGVWILLSMWRSGRR